MLGYGDGVDSTYSTFTMDFNSDPPLIEQRFQDFSFNLSNSSICSPDGNLLLYSNSVDILNNNDEIIINGEDFIDQPNELGTACNVLQHHIELPTYNDKSLPNLPNFRLKAEINSPCDTLRPIAQFSHLPDALEVTFTDESQRTPTAWQWTLGDGNMSEEQHPIHEYNQTGSYEVCLIASNEAGSDTTCQMIEIIIDSVEDLFLGQKVSINPNPSHGEFSIEFEYPTEENLNLELYDLNGRLLFTDQLLIGEFNYTFKDLSLESGMYILKLKSAVGNVLTRKVTISKF